MRMIRVAVIAVCVAGIAGMIIASATNHNGAAVTFGLITAVAVLCQMVATTVTNELAGAPGADVSGSPTRRAAGSPAAAPGTEPEAAAAAVEEAVERLVADGANETSVRDLARLAVRLGRATPTQSGPLDP